MAGANHCACGAYDCAYHLWKFTFNTNAAAPESVMLQDPKGDTISSGKENEQPSKMTVYFQKVFRRVPRTINIYTPLSKERSDQTCPGVESAR